MRDIAANVDAAQGRITAACDRAGRDASEVQLVAVGKKFTAEIIRAGADAGLTHFGENRMQEAKAKIPDCPGHLRWHFIGHLQTNKCRDAVEWFEMIHAVDSLHLADELNKRCEQAAKVMPVLLEVNVSGEGSKHGYAPDTLLAELEALATLSQLEIHGLMTMAPFTRQPETTRPYFARLRETRDACEERLGVPLPELSMGMSGDFDVAIEEGATLVRLGTALFGPRSGT
ncbi:MAG: YggS family pyridoxal phosphate-dependent enzyme [Verrucomicrobiota bacterium]|nr:YggS family pyridoxal phosphate-dependent enzyme [Verrucomicrobiota bacterium]